jgi:hypothetical protein
VREERGENEERAEFYQTKRKSSADVLAAAFERVSEDANMCIQALLSAKRRRADRSTTARAAKILSSDYYSEWRRADINKELDLIEDETKADIFVSEEGETRYTWLGRKVELM